MRRDSLEGLAAGASEPGILQIIDALILYDGPLLDQRFQETIAMHPDPVIGAKLKLLPTLVAHGSRETRRAAITWERTTGGGGLDDDFRRKAERVLLQAFLDSAEAQIRLKAFMTRFAPTREVRDHLDSAIAVHRDLAETLREAVTACEAPPDEVLPPMHEPARFIGQEQEGTDLRGAVENGIRQMREGGREPRVLILSHTAVRHLRDQGLFRDGDATVLDVPVEVDLSWDGSRYVLQSMDSVPLDEILAHGRAA